MGILTHIRFVPECKLKGPIQLLGYGLFFC